MNNLRKKLTALILATLVVSFSVSAQAASLTDVSDAMSSHSASATGVTHIIKFRPSTAIAAPGDVKITWAAGYDLTNVAASVDVTVSGGGVTWVTPVNGDLSAAARVLTLNWSSGTLSSATLVTVTVNFVKNPTSTGNYNLTAAVGPDGFSTATDTRTIPTVIASGDVAVSASVPYPATNPTITNQAPAGTVVVSNGASRVISFDLTDVNNDNIDYTVTLNGVGSISSLPNPVSPVSSTQNGVTVTFTYFANGGTGTPTITITADDTPVNGSDVITHTIQLFVS